MEAMIHALALDSRKNERRLLKAIKPVRKRAGKVRDMDVFSDFASQPQLDGETECFNRLLEYLRNQRQRNGRKLQKVAANRSPQIRKRLSDAASTLIGRYTPGMIPERNGRSKPRPSPYNYEGNCATGRHSTEKTFTRFG
jgi:CHAD domain-containing protein